ncbi:hypothetical protein [Candidatus Marithrix sp. Canyon 246]|uniref:hypothetical protein n=1 Tax=Candidatus Marithrix sp. Canyon 246 TaxID=1827136 RepID=UPI00084A1993|nr:hypothetical protein [Candidatus Marithrix sp. Canyon 246]
MGIRIGAAREYESAIELPMETNKYYGVFTWYWMQNLQQAQANDTWNNIFKRTAEIRSRLLFISDKYQPKAWHLHYFS